MYNMTCFTVKVSVGNFKVDKSENLDNAFYVFTFLNMTFSDFEKNVKTYFRTMFVDENCVDSLGLI